MRSWQSVEEPNIMDQGSVERAYRRLWSMQSEFLVARDSVEQLHIFDLTARAAQALLHWATRFPLIRRVRVWPLALSVAAAAPYSSVEALVSTA